MYLHMHLGKIFPHCPQGIFFQLLLFTYILIAFGYKIRYFSNLFLVICAEYIDVNYRCAVCMYVFGGCAAVTNDFPIKDPKILSLALSLLHIHTFIYISLLLI